MGEAAPISADENMAAWLLGPNTLRIQPFKLPALGPEDVKVQMKAVGICGSDVTYYRHLRCADFVVTKPMVIGHECAGVVSEVGSEVKHLKVGDRVALEPGVPCNRCRLCKGGRYNLCPDVEFFATPPAHGSLANFVVHPANQCFKLADNLTLEEGAMCEPLSVGVHGCVRGDVRPGHRVLVLGAGPIGLLAMLGAHAFGASSIVITDVNPRRLTIVKQLVPSAATLAVSTSLDDVDAEVESIVKLLGGEPDVALDCVGMEKTMRTALKATISGGKVCLTGMGHQEMKVPLAATVSAREVDLTGSFRYRNTYPVSLDLMASGKVDVKPLITHRFGFSQQELEDAFETSAKGGREGGDAIKVMFNL